MWIPVKRKQRILHECSCFIEFIKQVGGKVIAFFATSLINSINRSTNVSFYLSHDIKIT